MFNKPRGKSNKTCLSPLKVPCVIFPLFVQRKQVLIGQETSKAIPVLTSTTRMLLLRSIPPWVCFPKTTISAKRYHPRIHRHLIKPTARKESLFHTKISLLELEKNSYPAELKERGSRHDWIEGLGSVGYNSDHWIKGINYLVPVFSWIYLNRTVLCNTTSMA